MITLNNIGFDFGGRWLYKNANVHIGSGEKIGLIGKNGTGKSTLLRILTDEYSLTEGSFSKSSSTEIGFLNQDLQSFDSNDSVFNIALTAFHKQQKLELEINELLKKIETDPDMKYLEELDTKQNEFQNLGGYEMEATTHQVLAGLGFDEEMQERPYSSFSGGWRMRVMLVKILLQSPDLLLLDEPTNHLDLPSVQWLENYLLTFPGTYIIVSHDRYFLDKTCTRMLEVYQQKIYDYPGNYSFFLTEKAERIRLQQAAYDNQQRFIEDQERFIERFKAKASKASQAQSKLKQLDKLERIEAVEEDTSAINLTFRVKQKSGEDVLMIKNVHKAFGDRTLFNKTEGTIRRGDKIGLIGANGLGKSTLLRILADSEEFTGDRKLGYNVIESFFAQHQLEALDVKKSIIEEMESYVWEKGEPLVRRILGCFLFSGDDIHKKITVLSGGEKSRVALAKTLLEEANFLLLDEPTNHLDMQSIDILIQSLQQYEGTFIVVSHDRHFLKSICNKIWYIENQNLKEYPGTFEEYLEFTNKRALEQNQNQTKKVKEVKVVEPILEPNQKDPKVLRNEIKKIEREIEDLEKLESQLLAKLEDPKIASDYNQSKKIQDEYKLTQNSIASLMEKWEKLMEN